MAERCPSTVIESEDVTSPKKYNPRPLPVSQLPSIRRGECFLKSLLAGRPRIIIELVDRHSILTGDWLIQCYVVIHAPGSLGFKPGWATVSFEQL
jgi:hypothetical protein